MKKNIQKIIFFLSMAVFFSTYAAFADTTTPATSTTTPTPTGPTAEELLQGLQSILGEKMYSFFVDFTPQNPGANTQVSAQVTSYNFDVDRSSISWILNGKKAGAGKQFSFTTGNIGSQTVLRVSVTTPDGFSLSQTFYLGAAEVDLLWETPGYVPPVYRGKILAVSQSSVKVAAIPQGFKVSDSSLIYNWNLNGKEMPNLSGKGKNTFNFYTSVAGADVVKVRVSNNDQSITAEKSIQIKISDPKIIFYEENPLEGPEYQKGLGDNIDLAKSELILRAEPYFFSKRALSIIPWEWQMNDKKIAAPQKPNVLYLNIPKETTQGSSLIKLLLSNTLNVLETAEKALQINFNIR